MTNPFDLLVDKGTDTSEEEAGVEKNVDDVDEGTDTSEEEAGVEKNVDDGFKDAPKTRRGGRLTRVQIPVPEGAIPILKSKTQKERKKLYTISDEKPHATMTYEKLEELPRKIHQLYDFIRVSPHPEIRWTLVTNNGRTKDHNGICFNKFEGPLHESHLHKKPLYRLGWTTANNRTGRSKEKGDFQVQDFQNDEWYDGLIDAVSKEYEKARNCSSGVTMVAKIGSVLVYKLPEPHQRSYDVESFKALEIGKEKEKIKVLLNNRVSDDFVTQAKGKFTKKTLLSSLQKGGDFSFLPGEVSENLEVPDSTVKKISMQLTYIPNDNGPTESLKISIALNAEKKLELRSIKRFMKDPIFATFHHAMGKKNSLDTRLVIQSSENVGEGEPIYDKVRAYVSGIQKKWDCTELKFNYGTVNNKVYDQLNDSHFICRSVFIKETTKWKINDQLYGLLDLVCEGNGSDSHYKLKFHNESLGESSGPELREKVKFLADFTRAFSLKAGY